MDRELLTRKLVECFGEERVLLDEPMALHTTFQVGGPVDAFVSPSSVEEIEAAIEAARSANAPWHVIGRGSNLLVADRGVEGLVIHLGGPFSRIEVDGNELSVEAGATNGEVAEAACAAGLSGYEYACGIPGSIGGAAIMNAGAYDGQFSDVCSELTCLTLSGEVVRVSREEARWGYRKSMMADTGLVVLGARLLLVPFDREKIRARMEELTRRREEKQPLELGSAGSTFKRPVGYYAGKLIQDAGMQGHTVGGAQVSTKHAGFVVNFDHATASDVKAVIDDVREAVFADAGVTLEPEVLMWGFDDED